MGKLLPCGAPGVRLQVISGLPGLSLCSLKGEAFLHWCSGSRPLWAAHSLPLDEPSLSL